MQAPRIGLNNEDSVAENIAVVFRETLDFALKATYKYLEDHWRFKNHTKVEWSARDEKKTMAGIPDKAFITSAGQARMPCEIKPAYK